MNVLTFCAITAHIFSHLEGSVFWVGISLRICFTAPQIEPMVLSFLALSIVKFIPAV